MKFLIVRHGQTEANVLDIVQGTIDNPLSAIGHEQAKQIASRLSTENISAIYASPMQRAQKTAEYIAVKHDLPINITADLRETNFGVFEGRPWPMLKKFRESIVGPFENAAHPGGESFQEQLNRAENFIKGALSSHPSRSTAVVVTHGSFLRVLISKFINTPLRQLYEQPLIENCSLTILENNSESPGTGKIILWNDTCHLKK